MAQKLEQGISAGRQVRALRSPRRQEIVDALESAGPRSAPELAALIGRAPDAMYFHLRALERVGLLVRVGTRREGRHVSAVYDLPVRPLRLRYAAPAKATDIAAVIGAAMRTATRDFRRGLGKRGAALEGPAREVWGARAVGWVTPERLARLNALLDEASRLVRAGAPARDAQPISMSFVLAPTSGRITTPPRRGASKGGLS